MQLNETRSTSAAGLVDLLLRSGEALRNWRALATLMGTGVATIVIFLALASSGSAILIALGVLLSYLIVSVGMSATGILLMDQALGLVPRGITAALFDGLFAALRLIVVSLIGFAIALAVIIVVAILLVLCKIPGLGGLLYAIVLPISALAMAFVYASLYFVLSLAGSAVWSGASIRQAVSALYAIVRQRLVESALGVVVHTLLMVIIGGIVTAFVFAGVAVVLGLSAGILGSNIGIPNLSMMMMGGFGGGGLVYGGLFGFGILFAVVGAVLFSMLILGINRLYLHLTAGLDLASAEAALTSGMDVAKERARAMQEEARRRADAAKERASAMQEAARQRAEEMRQNTQTPAALEASIGAPASVPAAPTSPACPACGQDITAGDKFCEHCGHGLA